MSLRLFLIITGIATTLLGPSGVLAQGGSLDAAQRAYDQADFDRALSILGDFGDGTELEREDLVRALEIEALVHFAKRDAAAMAVSLRKLAVAAGEEHDALSSGPPPLMEAFAEARAEAEPITLDAELDEGTNLRVRGHAEGGEGLLRGVRVHARARDGVWQSGDDEVELVGASGAVEYWVEAVGPGGVTLAQIGSPDAPRVRVGQAAVAPAAAAATMEEDEGGFPVWGVVAAGGAAAVVTGIVLAVLLTSGDSDQVRLTGPVFEEP